MTCTPNIPLTAALGWLRTSQDEDVLLAAERLEREPSLETVLAALNAAARLDEKPMLGASHYLHLVGATVAHCPGEPPDPL